MARDDRLDGGPEEALPMLRWLRFLVTALAAVMGLGVLVIAALLWLRLSQPPLPELPEQIALPEGAVPAAVTFARDWLVVVTETGEVQLYDKQGRLHRQVQP
ncbi:DUF6476 family protein [Paracoccus denitrificans]|uniref:DUF6476 family protein n=1 Tax=Paracoccus denitrificans TaxID=266 RepID=UPI001E3CA763|nr:DUF6476 family protein [Paracoccus denitrificans]UFS65513.1 DUF6476 family protein [Paracoccus denitrificans]